LGSKIRIIPRQATQKEVYNIMSQTHCGVFPARAEGWNLELLEMMAMNKPVITTNYSAHKAFCTKDNAMLVDIDELEDANDNKYFHGFGKWAKFGDKQVKQFKDYMMYAYKNRLNTNPNGLKTATKFSWENATSILIECISK